MCVCIYIFHTHTHRVDLEQHSGWGADPLCSLKSAYNSALCRLGSSLALDVRAQVQPTVGPVALQGSPLENLGRSGHAQFTPLLFKGRL